MTTVPLGPVDYVFTGAGSQPITFAFVYAEKLHPGRLRKSLDEILLHFPLVQSRLRKHSGTSYVYELSTKALCFDVLESDDDFSGSHNIEQYITPVESVEGTPLTKISLTQAGKRSVLSVSMSHALVDGFSYFHFLSSWARQSRGVRFLPPVLDRDHALFTAGKTGKSVSSASLYTDCGLFYGNGQRESHAVPAGVETIFIPDAGIASLMEEARTGHVPAFTKNDVITAMLWKKYAALWNRDSGDPRMYITCPVDFRRLLSGFPRMYFGCALCFASADAGLHELREAPLGDLALKIKTSVGRIRDDFILNAAGTLNTFRKLKGLSAFENLHLRHQRHGMIITNLTRLPVQDLDFGSGAPVDFLTYSEVGAGAALLPAEGGIQAMVMSAAGNGVL